MANKQAIKSRRILVSVLSKLHEYGQLSRSAFFKIFDTKVLQILEGSELWIIERQSVPELTCVHMQEIYVLTDMNNDGSSVR